MPEGRPPARGTGRRWVYVAAAIAAASMLFGNKGFRRLISNTLLLRRLDAEKGALDLEEKRLKELVAAAKNDDKALERIIRKELGYHKPGEIEYRFTPPGREHRDTAPVREVREAHVPPGRAAEEQR